MLVDISIQVVNVCDINIVINGLRLTVQISSLQNHLIFVKDLNNLCKPNN